MTRRARIVHALLLATATLAGACDGPSPLERSTSRFLREGGDGVLGMTGTIQDLSFPEADGLVHVRVRKLKPPIPERLSAVGVDLRLARADLP